MAIAKPSFDLLLTLGLLAALSCKYDPHPANGIQKCAGADAGKQCPTGYECRAGLCYNTPADASGLGLDAPQSAGGNGGNGVGGSAGTGDTTAPPIDPDSGVPCGGLNRLCCANSSCLGSNTVCSAGNCVPCGTADQQCCSNNLCNSPLMCSGGTCRQPGLDGGSATSTVTSTFTPYDAGIATSTDTTIKTSTKSTTGTRSQTGSGSATATSTATTTSTATKADAGSDASTSTSITTVRTLPRTGIITGIGIGTVSSVSPGPPSTP